jgi:hypothetical protein
LAPFRLEISEHAAERFKQRGITRQHVRDCLARGSRIGFDLRGRFICAAQIMGRELIVVYLEIPLGVLVVTAYWKGDE